jgi:hypothetical protein
LTVGERLARGRRDSGLSVADVSSRTQIGPSVVDGIEHDDFSVCDGDFCARSQIRAIAEAVGVPAEPLVDEYDATGLAGEPTGATRAADLDVADEATEPIPAIEAAAPAMAAEQAMAAGPAPATGATRVFPAMPLLAGRIRGNWIVLLGVALLAVAVLGGYLLAFGGSGPAARHAAAAPGQQPGGHDRSHPAPRHSAGSTAGNGGRRDVLRPVHVTAFGPGGVNDGDHPQLAHLVLSSHAATPWHSSWYASADFGNLQSGTGLVLDMGRKVTVRAARIALGNGRGANLELRVGNALTLSQLQPVARVTGAARVVQMHAKPRQGRYVLVWFTKLPSGHSGTFQASVYKVTLLGYR